MIFSPNFIEIGYVERTHGTAGWIKLNLYNPENSIPKKGMEFLFLEMDSFPVPYRIEKLNAEAALVKLFDFDDPDKAQALVGKTILANSETLQVKRTSVWQPLNYFVYSQSNVAIGKVLDINEIPGNPLLEVETEHGMIQLPWNADFIISTDKSKKTIVYDVPEGLLAL